MEAISVSRVLAIMTLVLLTSVTVSAIPVSAEPRVIRVPQDYSTIQQAVDFALPGDMIIVGPGEYYGAFIVDKENVEIRGLEAVIVDGPPHDVNPDLKMGFFFPSPFSSGVTISGFTFMVDLPILGRGCTEVTVKYNAMIQPLQGVTCVGGSRWSISYNKIYGIKYLPLYFGAGVLITTTATHTLSSDNLVAFNKIAGDFPDFRELPPIGIWLSIDEGIVIRNKIVHNQVVMTGSGPALFSPAAIVMSCLNPNIQSLLYDNKIGFNDLRGSSIEIFGYPWGSAFWDYNDISRNLGANRAYDGVPPNEFKPLI